jgi:hypothetical protein
MSRSRVELLRRGFKGQYCILHGPEETVGAGLADPWPCVCSAHIPWRWPDDTVVVVVVVHVIITRRNIRRGSLCPGGPRAVLPLPLVVPVAMHAGVHRLKVIERHVDEPDLRRRQRRILWL